MEDQEHSTITDRDGDVLIFDLLPFQTHLPKHGHSMGVTDKDQLITDPNYGTKQQKKYPGMKFVKYNEKNLRTYIGTTESLIEKYNAKDPFVEKFRNTRI